MLAVAFGERGENNMVRFYPPRPTNSKLDRIFNLENDEIPTLPPYSARPSRAVDRSPYPLSWPSQTNVPNYLTIMQNEPIAAPKHTTSGDADDGDGKSPAKTVKIVLKK